MIGVPDYGTWCVVDGAVDRLIRFGADGSVRVADRDLPATAVESVFVDYADAPALPWGEFPRSAGYGLVEQPVDWDKTATVLADVIRWSLADANSDVSLTCVALGTRISIRAGVAKDDATAQWIAPHEVVEWLRRHRILTYTPADGAWTSLECELPREGPAVITPHFGEPEWFRDSGEIREYYEELRYLPRASAPKWLLAPAVEHHQRQREVPEEQHGWVQLARVFDGRDTQQRPQVFRPMLTSVEKRQIAEYLGSGTVVLSAMSTSEDELDPSRPAEVPKMYCTDGVWVWPMAMAYYLHWDDVAPPRDFLDHIRRKNYQQPEVVAPDAMQQAKALVLGTDVDSLDEGEAANAINLTRQTISDLQVSRRFYSFEQPLDGGWTMQRTGQGWWTVFCWHEGVRKNEARFPHVLEAGAYLIGCLALNQDKFRREPDEPLDGFECPLWPWPPDPHLDSFENRLITDLWAGTEVDRFGSADGNTVFLAGTTLPQRSMPPATEPGPYRRYRVVSALQVVSGAAKPEHGQVGGGSAYFLPQSLAELVAGGWLTAV